MGPAGGMIVLGHGFADADAFPVPPQLLLLGGAALVLAATAISSQYNRPVHALVRTLGRATTLVTRIVVLGLMVVIVAIALLGPSDIGVNAAPRLLFAVGWAGLLLVSALVGPVWVRANPLRWVVGDAPQDLFARAGVWPAVAGLVLFTAAEQIFDPSPLVALVVVGTYVVATAGGGVVYGRSWFRAADPIETASRLLGRMAPVGRRGRSVVARRIRAGVAGTDAAPGMAAFLGVLIGASLYDALEVGMSLGVRTGVFAAMVTGAAVVATASARPAILAPALIPAAAAHLGTHYLAPLLVDTQIAAIQLSDPFGRGWDLLGMTGAEFIAEPIPALAAQIVQLVLLVVGHALAMVVANDIAARRFKPHAIAATLFPVRAAILASLLAGLYLWLVA